MKYAEYIEEIEIDSLWSGLKHIKWTLDPKVNILSGINGVGKDTMSLIDGTKKIKEDDDQNDR